MIDTHVHLDLLDDPDALVNAAAAGVTHIVGIGVHPDTPSTPKVAVPAGLRISHVLGVHPQALTDDAALDRALATLRVRLDREDVVAVGETGLDARHGMPRAVIQERAFRAQLQLARARDLPVVLHGVRRDGAMLAVLDEEIARGGPVRTVWHGFSSSKDTMLHAVKRGAYISVGFLVLNEAARRLRDAVPHIPADRLVVETDAPPLPPARLKDVVAAVAKLRGVGFDEIVQTTTANARALFRFA